MSRKMASAAQVGAALARFLEDGGSLLGELAKLADLSDEQIRRLESEAETRASEGAALFSDRYCDFDLIGAGGMGIVYLALDTQLNRKVAVKIVRPPTTPHSETPNPTQIDPPGAGSTHEASYDELVDRFMQEAWLTGALEHPGIVPVYELGRTSRGVPYYTMRFVKGVRTLQGELGKAKTLNDRLVLLDPFLKICDAVRYAHSRGVIHRDLKPENIGLGEFGEVVVLDWGLAKMRDIPDRMESVWQQRIRELRETHDLKTAASALGTPGYMSPEAALGDFSHVDERSDVYSLGVVLHQILTGRLPFEFENYPELLHKLREESPQPASEIDRAIPVDLSRICAKALSREKPERFAGAGLLASAIRDYQHESAVRSEVRGLIQEAQAAFEGTKNLDGETLLRQLDRVMALCQRVLQHRTEHTRARQLLKECGARRKRAMEDREQAIEQEAHEKRIALIRRERERRERLFSRVALVGLMVIAIGAAVVAWILDAKRKEAQTAHESVLQTRGELGDAKTSQDRAERSAREASAEVARLRRALSSERTSTRAAKTEAARLHTELQAERSATRVARTEEKRVKAERDQVLVERDAARKNLDDANGEIANLRAALEAVTKAKREAEQRAEAERRAKERAIESAAARAGTQMTPPTESASEPHWSADQMQRLVALAR
ncbi:MAG: protein kinase domain-containing protein, partial [Planctomycetota bacterium]